MSIVCLVLFALLAMVGAVVPSHSTLGSFELRRRSNAGDKRAAELLRREELLGDIVSFLRVLQALLLVLFVTASVAAFGWLIGVVVAVAVALEYGAVARVSFLQTKAQTIYDKYEPALLTLVQKYPHVFRLLRTVTPHAAQAKQFDSREELQHMVDQAGQLITSDERKLITQSLRFDTRTVNEIMTPRGVIDSIGSQEVLGPLVLDDLHKTGHSRFPVTDGDVDHIVGVLYIQNLLTLNSKKTTTAKSAMEPRVFYIHQDQTLHHALAAFIRTKHHLFVVVNEFRETVGLLSLEDTIEALLGRKIVDEFDRHDDLRAVAARNPRGNNHPAKHEDV